MTTRRLVLAGAALALLVSAVPAGAQQPPAPPRPAPPSTWEVEFYRGLGPKDARISSGSGSLPGPGESFTTHGGSPSRRVTSWFFGDGAALLNDVLQANGRGERIRPLDSVLTSASAWQETRPGFGVRVARQLTPRYRIEIAVEAAPGSIGLLPETAEEMQLVQQSFATALAGLVAAGQGVVFTNPLVVTGVHADLTPVSGSDLLMTGALIFGGSQRGFFKPFVTLGGGVAKAGGETVATLSGRYAFTLPGGGRVDERDLVTVRFTGGLGIVALMGGGMKIHLTRTSGVRVEGRLQFVQHHIHTRVDTHPEVIASLPADAVWSTLSPGIQFATHPSSGLASNLSAPALSGERTMRGTGFQSRASLSIGYFVKF